MALPDDLQKRLDALKPRDEEPTKPWPQRIAEEVAAADAPPADAAPEPAAADASVDGNTQADPAPSDGLADLREKFAAETARREAMEKELLFLRKAATEQPKTPAQPEVDPVAQVMQALRVDEDTWAAMLADPKHGAQVASEALQRLFLLANQTATAKSLAEVQSILDQRDAALRDAQESNSLQTQFWMKNEDLEPYREVVQAQALAVANEQPNQQWTNDQIMTEVSRRSRAILKSKYSIDLTPATKPVARPRLVPARADMGGGAGRPTTQLTKVQRDLMRLAGRNVA